MKFQSRISTKQIHSIFYILLSLLILFILRSNPEEGASILAYIALVLLFLSIFNLFQESHKRYKILRARDTREYDNEAEEIIADYFKAKSIKFYLHPKVKVPSKTWIFNNPLSKITFTPDFFLPQYGAFVEYWDASNDEESRKKREMKEKAYKENDIEFISLYEGDLENRNKLDWNFTQKLLDLIREREGNNLKWRR